MASRLGSKRILKVLLVTGVLLLAIGIYFELMIKGEIPREAFVTTDDSKTHKLTADVEKTLETNEQGLSKVTVILQTTRGKIKFKFYSKDAPRTSHRIALLIQNGFYNGLTFHRVVPGFIIQGGDPTNSGSGGSGVTLEAELNQRKHVAGTVAMARAQEDPNSADSQFYITLGAQPQLDRNDTVFGQVIDGMEVVNQIQMGDRMTSVTLEIL